MKENKIEKLIFIVFAAIGTLFLIIGLPTSINRFNYKNKIETIGTISEISNDRNDNYKVYVSYKVDNENFESRLNAYSESFYEGKEINIYYDKNNPSLIGMKSMDLLFLIFPGIGLIFLIIGVIGLFIKLRKKSNVQKLKQSGKKIYANYVETTINTSYSVNGKNPYNIICEWVNPKDNKRYIFKSENIWIDPTEIIENEGLKQFPVYIDNKNNYVVEVDVLTKNIVDLR